MLWYSRIAFKWEFRLTRKSMGWLQVSTLGLRIEAGKPVFVTYSTIAKTGSLVYSVRLGKRLPHRGVAESLHIYK